MYLGADAIGYRLNKIYKENLDEVAILKELDVLLGSFKAKRKKKESFGDFIMREGIV